MSACVSSRNSFLSAPFPYFGGKRAVSDIVWSSIGDVAHYVEPFFGSGAVLLSRPTEPKIETVNDIDGFVANFWRAVRSDPEAVADSMNWPVNEIDLESRHRWLCRMPDKQDFLDRMKHDPEHYDVKRAGLWCWGLAQWIGSHWCGGEYYPSERQKSKGTGVCSGANRRPHLSDAGKGVHRQLPHLGDAGMGVHRQLPHLGNAGMGVHRKRPHLGDAGIGETERRRNVLREWMNTLADRLRNVRVCCGDWSRICTNGATAHSSSVGVFLDPPYSGNAGRHHNIYRHEDLAVSDSVRDWCKRKTEDRRYRIVLAGYEGEHDELEPMGWSVVAWKARGGYGNNGNGNGKKNAHRERLWISPSCEDNEALLGYDEETKASKRK